MTALSEIEGFSGAGTASTARAQDELFVVDETYWGYIVRSTEPAPISVLLLQGMAWLVGIGFVVATLGLWLLPTGMSHSAAIGMKLGASVITGSSAALCLWFASRGTQSEIQIDTRLGEVREVVRNRAGTASLIARYGFDAIGGVFIDRTGATGEKGALVLRYRNTAQTLEVATGGLSNLAPLRDRLGRDLMVLPRVPLRAAAPGAKSATRTSAKLGDTSAA